MSRSHRNRRPCPVPKGSCLLVRSRRIARPLSNILAAVGAPVCARSSISSMALLVSSLLSECCLVSRLGLCLSSHILKWRDVRKLQCSCTNKRATDAALRESRHFGASEPARLRTSPARKTSMGRCGAKHSRHQMRVTHVAAKSVSTVPTGEHIPTSRNLKTKAHTLRGADNQQNAQQRQDCVSY